MPITSDQVREIFKGLEEGDSAAFFQHVADDVNSCAILQDAPLRCAQCLKIDTRTSLPLKSRG
jgi:hypothetical protein